ncbi:hypothetical protein [Actinokineospora inagensis]|uniref:hypothetical protein n=1 Tax=Actinokineospora inagensis TaxID=103730 RepID=UPI00041B744E|nr:hypothetical protein [Actinokineospora inagensis]
MSEQEPEPAAQPAEPSQANPGTPPTPESNTPPTRDEALNRLRASTADLRSARNEEIVAEAFSRAGSAANVNLYHFSGDFSVEEFAMGGGTKSRRGTGKRSAKVWLDAEVLHGEHERYAKPADFDRGVDVVDLRNIVVYSGPARSGRTARAKATMVEVLRRSGWQAAYCELGASVLGNMAWQPPHRECAYLVRDLPNASSNCAAESIGDAWLAHASARAKEHDAYLVVVTGPVRGALATATTRQDYVLTDLDVPDSREIVRKRIGVDVDWLTESEVEEQLAATDLDDILDERDDPKFATRAAHVVIEALRACADLAEVVSRLRNAPEQVREWLGADPDAADVALVLATAALEGCGYLSVADAAVSLYRKLGNNNAAMTPRYLRGLLAERSWIELVETDSGNRVARFRHAALRAPVLELVWVELDGARDVILKWLAELAAHRDVEVRARAAYTAGLLAACDLEHGLHRYFLPWAQHESPVLRQSAATGLDVAGTVSGRPEVFWTHVEQWANLIRYDDDARELAATAALAAGRSLGIADPKRALRVLRTLIDEGDWDLLGPVAISTQMLLAADQQGPVIEALREWTDAPVVDERVIKALSMFAFAASEKGTGDRPVLMASAWQLREDLPELWGRALACEPVRRNAADALWVWVHMADTDPTCRPEVLDLLAGIADRGDQDYGRLRHLLEQWADDRLAPSAAADYFLTQLLEEGELSA